MNLGVMAMNGYSTFIKTPELEPQHWFSVIQNTCWKRRGLTLQQKYSQHILQTPQEPTLLYDDNGYTTSASNFLLHNIKDGYVFLFDNRKIQLQYILIAVCMAK